MIPSPHKAIVLYHANCVDGFAAAWVFNRLQAPIFKEVIYHEVSYGELPPQMYSGYYKDSYVYILDFSYAKKILTELCTEASSVVLIDHHKTLIDLLNDWEDIPINLDLKLSLNKCGAMLTWEYLNKTLPVPLFIRYVQDRDLWKHELDNTKEISAYIASADKTMQSYDQVNKEISDWENNYYEASHSIIRIGSALLAQHTRMVNDIVKNARPIIIYGNGHTTFRGLACNCTHHFASDVGSKLAEDTNSVGTAYYTDVNGDVCFSLRSVGELDVSYIAKMFGGGGHKNAAGFKLKNTSTNHIQIYSDIEANTNYIEVFNNAS